MRKSESVGGLELFELGHPGCHNLSKLSHGDTVGGAQRVADVPVLLGVVGLVPFASVDLNLSHGGIEDSVLGEVQHAIAICVSICPGLLHFCLMFSSECLIGLVPLHLFQGGLLLFFGCGGLPLVVLSGGPGVNHVEGSLGDCSCFYHFV